MSFPTVEMTSSKCSFDTVMLTYLGQFNGLEGQWHGIYVIRTVMKNLRQVAVSQSELNIKHRNWRTYFKWLPMSMKSIFYT